jgi:hypothetical protein
MQSKSGFALNQQLIGWPGDSFKLKLEEVLVMSLHEVLSTISPGPFPPMSNLTRIFKGFKIF